ncbi:hypothetical protein HAX54_011114, partial [Datura stramonium]|nr:hypothetical protein [Datura stramonium]
HNEKAGSRIMSSSTQYEIERMESMVDRILSYRGSSVQLLDGRLGCALHVLKKSYFVFEVIGTWSSVRKGPRTEKRADRKPPPIKNWGLIITSQYAFLSCLSSFM